MAEDLTEMGIPYLCPYRLARGCENPKPANGSLTVSIP